MSATRHEPVDDYCMPIRSGPTAIRDALGWWQARCSCGERYARRSQAAAEKRLNRHQQAHRTTPHRPEETTTTPTTEHLHRINHVPTQIPLTAEEGVQAARLLAALEAAGEQLGVSPSEWSMVTSLPTACVDVIRARR